MSRPNPGSPSRPRAARGAALLLAALLAACSSDQALAPRAAPPPSFSSGATITVTTLADAGAGSLRQAIADAPAGATIDFDPGLAGKKIALTSGALAVAAAVTIEGPATGGVTVDAGYASSVFVVDAADAEVTLRNLTITRGYAVSGGGVLVNAGSVTLDRVTLFDNAAGAYGGAIYNAGTVRLVNSTVAQNRISGLLGGSGGGIYSTGGATLVNSTVANNTLLHLTLPGSSLPTGAGIVATGATELRNSIVAGNTGDGDYNCQLSGGATLTGRNLATDFSCGASGVAMIVADPKLGGLADNGGPARTYALAYGSPAIDGAADCTVSVDERGVARPQGQGCDIGAYEYDFYYSPALAMDASASVNTKTGVALVTGTLVCTDRFGGGPTLDVDVTLAQPQKAGKVNVTVQGTARVSVPCAATPTAWSAFVKPAGGAFQSGAATGGARTATAPSYVTPASTSAPVKLFWSKG